MTSDRLQLDQILRELSSYLQLSCSTFMVQLNSKISLSCIYSIAVSLSDADDRIRSDMVARRVSRHGACQCHSPHASHSIKLSADRRSASRDTSLERRGSSHYRRTLVSRVRGDASIPIPRPSRPTIYSRNSR